MAAQIGIVEVGMLLICVQDIPCEEVSFGEALDLIREAERPLVLKFRKPALWDKAKMEWVEETDWDAALDISYTDSTSVGAADTFSTAEQHEAAQLGCAQGVAAPPLVLPCVGLSVRVRPAPAAEAACLAVGVKWNAARARQAVSREVGFIDSIDSSGAADGCAASVRVRWAQEQAGRTDLVHLLFPIDALEQAVARHEELSSALQSEPKQEPVPVLRPVLRPEPDSEPDSDSNHLLRLVGGRFSF